MIFIVTQLHASITVICELFDLYITTTGKIIKKRSPQRTCKQRNKKNIGNQIIKRSNM